MTTVIDTTAQLATAPPAQLAAQLTATLTPDERARLDVCEKEIRQGLYAWQIMAAALREVRDGRLYRETHATFDSYCKERWNVGASRIRQLCSAVQTAEALPAVTLPSERHARAAGRLLRAEGPEVATETLARLESTGPLTVARIEAEVEPAQVDSDDPNWVDHSALLAAAIVQTVSDYVTANGGAIRNNEICQGVVIANIALSDAYPTYCPICSKGRKHVNSTCPLATVST